MDTTTTWTAKPDGNYSATTTSGDISAIAATVATVNERGAACFGLSVTVTRDGSTQTCVAPGTFFRAVDWGTLAERYLARARAGKTGEDIFAGA